MRLRSMSQAEREGWTISNSSDGYPELQKIDECTAFRTDKAAFKFVERQAATGSAYHIGVLAWLRIQGRKLYGPH